MEYESTQAKKLVKMLETSEAQEKAYWLRRTRRAILIWSMIFVIATLSAVFIILGLNERNKYVNFDLHFVKYSDDASEEPQIEHEERKASIYDTIKNIELPNDIEGYNFNGKYFNSSNFEVLVNPESNIASSLTYEKAIYMQYELGHYRLSILTSQKDNDIFTSGDGVIGYNKTMYVVPSSPIATDNNAIDRFLDDRKDYIANNNVDYIGNNLYNLYALKFSEVNESNNSITDIDGKLNNHIFGFHMSYKGQNVQYYFYEVVVKNQANNAIFETYLVEKYINGELSARNFSNNYAVLLTDEGEPKVETATSGDKYYFTDGTILDDNSQDNANVFKMPGHDVTVYIDWMVDDRYVIVMDTVDEYTWNRIYSDYIVQNNNSDTYQNIKESFGLDYNTPGYLENAKTDGVDDDWDHLKDNLSEYYKENDGVWDRTAVKKISADDANANIKTYLDTYFKKGYNIATINSGHAFPYYKFGYETKKETWQIYTYDKDLGKYSWVNVDNTTNLNAYAQDVCIVIRATWNPYEYYLEFKDSGNAVGTLSNFPGYGSSGDFGRKLTMDLVNNLESNTTKRVRRLISGSDKDFLYLTKTGHEFVGWQLNGKLSFNTSVGENGKGYFDIDTTSDNRIHVIVESPTFKYKINSLDEPLEVEATKFLNYNYNDNIDNQNRKLWKYDTNYKGKSYTFYYFGTKTELESGVNSKMEIPVGYYATDGAKTTLELNPIWSVISYEITVDFNIDSANELELGEAAGGKTIYGFGNIYGLDESFDYNPNTEGNQQYDEIVTDNNGYETGFKIIYDVNTAFYLPGYEQLYRRGYKFTGYKFYKVENGNKVELTGNDYVFTIGESSSDKNIYEKVLINAPSIAVESNTTKINNLFDEIIVEAQWEAEVYKVGYNTTATADQSTKVKSITTQINYNMTLQTPNSNITHYVWDEDVEINNSGKFVKNTYTYIFPKDRTTNASAVIYVKLKDMFSNSTFRLILNLDGKSYEYSKEDLLEYIGSNSIKFEDNYSGIKITKAEIKITKEEIGGETYYKFTFVDLACDVKFNIDQIDYDLVANTLTDSIVGDNVDSVSIISTYKDLKGIYTSNQTAKDKVNFVIVRDPFSLVKYNIYDMLNIKKEWKDAGIDLKGGDLDSGVSINTVYGTISMKVGETTKIPQLFNIGAYFAKVGTLDMSSSAVLTLDDIVKGDPCFDTYGNVIDSPLKNAKIQTSVGHELMTQELKSRISHGIFTNSVYINGIKGVVVPNTISTVTTNGLTFYENSSPVAYYTIKNMNYQMQLTFEGDYKDYFSTWKTKVASGYVLKDSTAQTFKTNNSSEYITTDKVEVSFELNNIVLDTIEVKMYTRLSPGVENPQVGTPAVGYNVLNYGDKGEGDILTALISADNTVYSASNLTKDKDIYTGTYTAHSTFVFEPIFTEEYSQYNDKTIEEQKNLILYGQYTAPEGTKVTLDNGLFANLNFDEDGGNAKLLEYDNTLYIQVYVTKLSNDNQTGTKDVYVIKADDIINSYGLTFGYWVTENGQTNENKLSTSFGAITINGTDITDTEKNITYTSTTLSADSKNPSKLLYGYNYIFKVTLNDDYSNSKPTLRIEFNNSENTTLNFDTNTTTTTLDSTTNILFEYISDIEYQITLTNVQHDLTLTIENVYRNLNTFKILGYTSASAEELSDITTNFLLQKDEGLVPINQDDVYDYTYMYKATVDRLIKYSSGTFTYYEQGSEIENIEASKLFTEFVTEEGYIIEEAGGVEQFIIDNYTELRKLTDDKIFKTSIAILVQYNYGMYIQNYTYITNANKGTEFKIYTEENRDAFANNGAITLAGATKTDSLELVDYSLDSAIKLTQSTYEFKTINIDLNLKITVKPKVFTKNELIMPEDSDSIQQFNITTVYNNMAVVIMNNNFEEFSDDDYITNGALNENISYQSYAFIRIKLKDAYNQHLSWTIKNDKGEQLGYVEFVNGVEDEGKREGVRAYYYDEYNKYHYYAVLLTSTGTSDLGITIEINNPINTYEAQILEGKNSVGTYSKGEGSEVENILSHTTDSYIATTSSGKKNESNLYVVEYGQDLSYNVTIRPGYEKFKLDITSSGSGYVDQFVYDGGNWSHTGSSSSNINGQENPKINISSLTSSTSDTGETIYIFTITINDITADTQIELHTFERKGLSVNATNISQTTIKSQAIATEDEINDNLNEKPADTNFSTTTTDLYYGDSIKLTLTVNAGYEKSGFKILVNGCAFEFDAKKYVDSERNFNGTYDAITNSTMLTYGFSSISVAETMTTDSTTYEPTITVTITIYRVIADITVEVSEMTKNSYTVSGTDTNGVWELTEGTKPVQETTPVQEGKEAQFKITVPAAYNIDEIERITLKLNRYAQDSNNEEATIVVTDTPIKLNFKGMSYTCVRYSAPNEDGYFIITINALLADIEVKQINISLNSYAITVGYNESKDYLDNVVYQTYYSASNTNTGWKNLVDINGLKTTGSGYEFKVEHGYHSLIYFELTGGSYFDLNLLTDEKINKVEIKNTEKYGTDYSQWLIDNFDSLTDMGVKSSMLNFVYNGSHQDKLHGENGVNNDNVTYYFVLIFYSVDADTKKEINLDTYLGQSKYSFKSNEYKDGETTVVAEVENSDITYDTIESGTSITILVNEAYTASSINATFTITEPTTGVSDDGTELSIIGGKKEVKFESNVVLSISYDSTSGVITITWYAGQYYDIEVTFDNFKINTYKLTFVNNTDYQDENNNVNYGVNLVFDDSDCGLSNNVYTFKAYYTDINNTKYLGTDVYIVTITTNKGLVDIKGAKITDWTTFKAKFSDGLYYTYDDIKVEIKSVADDVVINWSSNANKVTYLTTDLTFGSKDNTLTIDKKNISNKDVEIKITTQVRNYSIEINDTGDSSNEFETGGVSQSVQTSPGLNPIVQKDYAYNTIILKYVVQAEYLDGIKDTITLDGEDYIYIKDHIIITGPSASNIYFVLKNSAYVSGESEYTFTAVIVNGSTIKSNVIIFDGDYTFSETGGVDVQPYEYTLNYFDSTNSSNTLNGYTQSYVNESITYDTNEENIILSTEIKVSDITVGNIVVTISGSYISSESSISKDGTNWFGSNIYIPYGSTVVVAIVINETIAGDSFKSSTEFDDGVLSTTSATDGNITYDDADKKYTYTYTAVDNIIANQTSQETTLKLMLNRYTVTMPANYLSIASIEKGGAFISDVETDVTGTNASGQSFVIEYNTEIVLQYTNTSNMDYANITGDFKPYNNETLAGDLVIVNGELNNYYYNGVEIGSAFKDEDKDSHYTYTLIAGQDENVQNVTSYSFGVNYDTMRYIVSFTGIDNFENFDEYVENNFEGIESIDLYLSLADGTNKKVNYFSSSLTRNLIGPADCDYTENFDLIENILSGLLCEKYIYFCVSDADDSYPYYTNDYELGFILKVTLKDGYESFTVIATNGEKTNTRYGSLDDNGVNLQTIYLYRENGLIVDPHLNFDIKAGDINNYSVTLTSENLKFSGNNKSITYNQNHGANGTFSFKFDTNYSNAEYFYIQNTYPSTEIYTFIINGNNIKDGSGNDINNTVLTFGGVGITIVSATYDGTVTIKWMISDNISNTLKVYTDDINGYNLQINLGDNEDNRVTGVKSYIEAEAEKQDWALSSTEQEIAVTATATLEFTLQTHYTQTEKFRFVLKNASGNEERGEDNPFEIEVGTSGSIDTWVKYSCTRDGDTITITFSDITTKFSMEMLTLAVNWYDIKYDSSNKTYIAGWSAVSTATEHSDYVTKVSEDLYRGLGTNCAKITIKVADEYSQLNNAILTFGYGSNTITYKYEYYNNTLQWRTESTDGNLLSFSYNTNDQEITFIWRILDDLTVCLSSADENTYKFVINYITYDSSSSSWTTATTTNEVNIGHTELIYDALKREYSSVDTDKEFMAKYGLKFVGYILQNGTYGTNCFVGENAYIKDSYAKGITYTDDTTGVEVSDLTLYACYERGDFDIAVQTTTGTTYDKTISFGQDIAFNSTNDYVVDNYAHFKDYKFQYISGVKVGAGISYDSASANSVFTNDDGDDEGSLLDNSIVKTTDDYLAFLNSYTQQETANKKLVMKYSDTVINLTFSFDENVNLGITDLFTISDEEQGYVVNYDGTYKYIPGNVVDSTTRIGWLDNGKTYYQAISFEETEGMNSVYVMYINESKALVKYKVASKEKITIINASGEVPNVSAGVLESNTTVIDYSDLAILTINGDKNGSVAIAEQYNGLTMGIDGIKDTATSGKSLNAGLLDKYWGEELDVHKLLSSSLNIEIKVVASKMLNVNFEIYLPNGTYESVNNFMYEENESLEISNGIDDIIARAFTNRNISFYGTDTSNNLVLLSSYYKLAKDYTVKNNDYYTNYDSTNGFANFIIESATDSSGNDKTEEAKSYLSNEILNAKGLIDAGITSITLTLDTYQIRGAEETPFIIENNATWDVIMGNVSKNAYVKDLDGNDKVEDGSTTDARYYYAQTEDLELTDLADLNYNFYGHYYGTSSTESVDDGAGGTRERLYSTINRVDSEDSTNIDTAPVFGKINANSSVKGLNIVGDISETSLGTGWTAGNYWGNLAVSASHNIEISDIVLGTSDDITTTDDERDSITSSYSRTGALLGTIASSEDIDNRTFTINNIVNNYNINSTNKMVTNVGFIDISNYGRKATMEIDNVVNNGDFNGLLVAGTVIVMKFNCTVFEEDTTTIKYSYNENSSLVISNSENNGELISDDGSGSNGRVAGIAYIESSFNVVLDKCTNSGKITNNNNSLSQTEDDDGNVSYTLSSYTAGIVVSNANILTINNCINKGQIEHSLVCSGICVLTKGKNDTAKITINSCTNEGKLIGSGYVTGIVFNAKFTEDLELEIKNCENTETLETNDNFDHEDGKNFSHIAGIYYALNTVFSNNVKLCNNTNSGTLKNDSIYNSFIYGISKSNHDIIIEGCNNEGVLVNDGARQSEIYGIACAKGNATLTNCTNSGTFTHGKSSNVLDTASEMYGVAYVGGKGTIQGCSNSGEFNHYSTGYTIMCGVAYIEGEGNLSSYTYTENGYDTTVNCTNSGAFNNYSNNALIAGVAIIDNNGTLSNCYNTQTGEFNNYSSSSTEAASDNLVVAVGVAYLTGQATLTNCTNSGAFNNNINCKAEMYGVALVENNVATLTNCSNSGAFNHGTSSNTLSTESKMYGVAYVFGDGTLTGCVNNGEFNHYSTGATTMCGIAYISRDGDVSSYVDWTNISNNVYCINTGLFNNYTGAGKSTMYGIAYIGGVGELTYCDNRGAFNHGTRGTTSSAESEMYGVAYVGGVADLNYCDNEADKFNHYSTGATTMYGVACLSNTNSVSKVNGCSNKATFNTGDGTSNKTIYGVAYIGQASALFNCGNYGAVSDGNTTDYSNLTYYPVAYIGTAVGDETTNTFTLSSISNGKVDTTSNSIVAASFPKDYQLTERRDIVTIGTYDSSISTIYVSSCENYIDYTYAKSVTAAVAGVITIPNISGLENVSVSGCINYGNITANYASAVVGVVRCEADVKTKITSCNNGTNITYTKNGVEVTNISLTTTIGNIFGVAQVMQADSVKCCVNFANLICNDTDNSGTYTYTDEENQHVIVGVVYAAGNIGEISFCANGAGSGSKISSTSKNNIIAGVAYAENIDKCTRYDSTTTTNYGAINYMNIEVASGEGLSSTTNNGKQYIDGSIIAGCIILRNAIVDTTTWYQVKNSGQIGTDTGYGVINSGCIIVMHAYTDTAKTSEATSEQVEGKYAVGIGEKVGDYTTDTGIINEGEIAPTSNDAIYKDQELLYFLDYSINYEVVEEAE